MFPSHRTSSLSSATSFSKMADQSTKATSLRVGVLVIPPVQLLDLSPIDLFGMCSPDYLSVTSLPKPLLKLAIPVTIHYISASGPNSNVQLTANAQIRATASLTSPEVQPGELDTLLLPGPDPNLVPDQPYLDFLRAHEKAGKTDILVICTGSYAAGYAGILNGKRVSGPRGLLPDLKKKFPEANYVERRYETDGKLWSAGMNSRTIVVHSWCIGHISDTNFHRWRHKWPRPCRCIPPSQGPAGTSGPRVCDGRC